MPEGYLAGLDATAGLPRFERALRDRPSILVLELHGSIVGFSRYGPSRDADARPHTGEVIAINVIPPAGARGSARFFSKRPCSGFATEAMGRQPCGFSTGTLGRVYSTRNWAGAWTLVPRGTTMS
jgi:hypothetical protein